MEMSSIYINQTGLTWQIGLVSNLYFESVVQLAWVGLKYSVEPVSILHVEPVVLFA